MLDAPSAPFTVRECSGVLVHGPVAGAAGRLPAGAGTHTASRPHASARGARARSSIPRRRLPPPTESADRVRPASRRPAPLGSSDALR